MSNRYKGAVISATPPTTSGGETGTASGVWTLEQQMQLTAASLWPIQPLPKYIEDVFSTYLYTGNGTSQTITNGINISGNGGLVWIKPRSLADNHSLFDTARGALNRLRSNDTTANVVQAHGVSAFNTTGFSITGANGETNQNAITYASWTFREQAKFFDIVTWTGTGVARTIAHNLGSTPGCIIVKRTDTTANWEVFHRAIQSTPASSADYSIQLNLTNAAAISSVWNSGTPPTSSVFSVDSGATVNASGGTYVAYLFAHDAGGFGTAGTDNVISCGSYTGTGSTPLAVTLGYEPQWLLVKKSSGGANWYMQDVMRGMPISDYGANLFANLSNAEAANTWMYPTATGFAINDASINVNESGQTYIYIAIRRGPMKVPTVGTSVFSPVARVGTSATATVTAGFPVDMTIIQDRNGLNSYATAFDRLRGATKRLFTALTLAEATEATSLTGFDVQTGFTLGTDLGFGAVNTSPDNYINWCFGRAPSVFDIVCYTGDSSDPKTVSHNLGVAPELMIFKARDVAAGWRVWGGNMAITEYLALSEDSAVVTGPAFFGGTLPTATSFYVGSGLNTSGRTIVAYLFATCAGVSKVGSYTGNAGYTVTVPCGFTAGVRFVLIKRTDSTGDWYVWDSARGIVAGNDPYLLLNSTAAEVTGTDYVDTYAAGFEVTSTAPAGLNATGGTYIFLAIA